MTLQGAFRTFAVLLLLVAVQACAPTVPPNVAGPRGNVAPYPVLLAEDDHRTEAATAAINHLMSIAVDGTTAASLYPVTATIESLPKTTAIALLLPKLGINATMSEEETRESLRRFIRDWQGPIGADPAKLSLVERVDLPDGTKVARYEQRAFRYPIRGDYGKLEIRFTPERRLLNITSTCIPDADKIQTALSAVTTKLKPEDPLQQVTANEISYSGTGATALKFRLTANNKLELHELVTYVTPAAQTNALAFYVAWEVGVSGAPFQIVYVDAVSGEVVGTR
jgi:hypothetical protein